MQLIGQTVSHEIFGKGTVTGRDQQTLTVHFPQGNHSFLYPEAFSKYLVAQNADLQQRIIGMLHAQQQEQQAREEAEMARWEKATALRSLRIPSRSQGVFDIAPDERIFESWTLSTGCYLSGFSRGEPRIPDRLGPNSLCILTRVNPGEPEAGRKIIGLAMADDEFSGIDCEDGRVPTHPVYRMKLEPEQQLPFWPFVTDEEKKKKWGKTAFKYLPNELGELILRRICRKYRSDAADAFYRYFCELNHLNPAEDGK